MATGDIRTLRGIIAMLAALAVLAEHAAGRSLPVRWLALTILRRGEMAACAYAADATQCEWPCLADPGELRHDPADAILLAARFRMMAAMLVALLPPEALAGRGGHTVGGPDRFAPRPGRPGLAPAGLAAGPYDTS